MKFSFIKNFVTAYLFISVSAFSGTVNLQCSPKVSWEHCLKNGKFKEFQFKLFDSKNTSALKLYFMNSSEAPCPSSGFPILHSRDDRVSNWIQIILSHHDHSKGDEIKVDTSLESKKNGRPFYKDQSIDSQFFDSPCWTFDGKDKIKWEALLFPVNIEKKKIIPLGGVKWGWNFDGDNKKLTPILPQALSKEDWNIYQIKLKKDYPNWDFY